MLCAKRARPASSSARSAAGTGTPGGGTGLMSAACAAARIRNTGSSRFMWKTILLFRVQRALGSLEELILKPQADLIGFHGPDDVGELIGPRLHVELAQLTIGASGVSRIVFRETRIPTDPGHDSCRQVQAIQIGAGLRTSAVHVNQFRAADQDVRSLGFPGMAVARRLERRPSRYPGIGLRHVHHVIP